jgi:signal peptidase I
MKADSRTIIEQPAVKQPAIRQQSRPRRALRWVERMFAVFGVLCLLYVLTVDISIITSPSMSPALQGKNVENGDRVVTEKVTRWFRQPRRWEVIAFTRDDGVQLMKRVVGLPGESVQLSKDRRLLIDGKPVELPPGLNQKYLRFGNLFEGKPVPCGEGYYVLGDDLKDSDDSRFNGPVKPSRLIGRAWLIVSPWNRFGFVR